ncbi:MAG: hypothetical protein KatS3mg058_2099 [Roseiflexus sp.]|nr:MAG: hypothetical protein KatS3mg058_2099 [Roseiflexus sp.]
MREQEGAIAGEETEVSEWDDFVAQIRGEIEHCWFIPAATRLDDCDCPAVGMRSAPEAAHRAVSGRRRPSALSAIIRHKLLLR